MLSSDFPDGSLPLQDEREEVRGAIGSIFHCIPPIPLSRIIERGMLGAAMSVADMDYWTMAGLDADSEATEAHLEEGRVIEMLKSVSIDGLILPEPSLTPSQTGNHALLDRIRKAVHEQPPTDTPTRRPASSAVVGPVASVTTPHFTDSEAEETASVHSAVGTIPPLRIQLCKIKAGKGARRTMAASRLTRLSINAAGEEGRCELVVCSKVEALIGGSVLEGDGEAAIRNADPSAHYPEACRVIQAWESIPEQHHLMAAAFATFCCAQAWAHTAPPSVPFDVDQQICKVMSSLRKTSSEQLGQSLADLKCLLTGIDRLLKGCIPLDDSTLNGIAALTISLLNDKLIRRSLFSPHLKAVIGGCVRRVREQRVAIFEDLVLSGTFGGLAEATRITTDLILSTLTSLGGKEAFTDLLSLSKAVTELLWTKVQDSRVLVEKREVVLGIILEILQSVPRWSRFPSLLIAQQMVPLCFKALASDSSADIFTKCRFLDILGNVLMSLQPQALHAAAAELDGEYSKDFLDLYEAWAASLQAPLNHYHALLQQSSIFKSADKLFAFILSQSAHEAVNLRLKALRCLAPLFANTGQREWLPLFSQVLSLRLSDVSPAIRDFALDVASRPLIVQSEGIFEAICSRLNAIKCVGGIVRDNLAPSTKLTTKALSSLINNMFDIDSRVADLAFSSVKEGWLLPRLAALSNNVSFEAAATNWDRRKVGEFCDELIAIFSHVKHGDALKTFMTKCLHEQEGNLGSIIQSFMDLAVECLLDRLVGLPEGLNSGEAAGYLDAISVLVEGNVGSLEPHLAVLFHFLESQNPGTVASAAMLMAQLFPHVSITSIKALSGGLVETLTRTIIGGTESAVQASVDCLFVYCSVAGDGFGLIVRLWEKFSRFLKNQIEGGGHQAAASQSRALFALGCLCRHAGFGKAGDPTLIPSHVHSAITIFQKCYKMPQSADIVRLHALQALCMAIKACPIVALEEKVTVLLAQILKLSSPRHYAIILGCLTDVATPNKGSSMTGDGFDPSAPNRASVSSIVSKVIQMYLPSVIQLTTRADSDVKVLCLRLLMAIYGLGITNPFEITPTIIGFTGSSSEALRAEAALAVDQIFDKHPAFVSSQLPRTIMSCYQVGCEAGGGLPVLWQYEALDTNELYGPLSIYFYKLSRVKSGKRGPSGDFIGALIKLMTASSDFNFICWAVHSASLLRFTCTEEASELVKGLATATALFADSLIEAEECPEGIEVIELLRFIALSRFTSHLSRHYGIDPAKSATESGVEANPESKRRRGTRNTLPPALRPKPLPVSLDWGCATVSEAFTQVRSIIEDDLIKVSIGDYIARDEEETSEVSLKSPTLIPTKRPGRRRRTSANSSSTESIHKAANIPERGARRRRSSNKSVNYFESSDGE